MQAIARLYSVSELCVAAAAWKVKGFFSLSLSLQMSYFVRRNPMSSLQLSHMGLINYLNRTSALCLAHMATSISGRHANLIGRWQRGYRTRAGSEHLRSNKSRLKFSDDFFSSFDESFKVVPSVRLGKSQLKVFSKVRPNLRRCHVDQLNVSQVLLAPRKGL